MASEKDETFKTVCPNCDAVFEREYFVCPVCGAKVQKEPDLQRKISAKHDSGKPKLSLVPCEIIRAIAKVREFGVKKYKDPDNWKQVEAERYRDAMYRHLLLYIEDPYGIDEESGLPHLHHLACNVAFLCEMEKTFFLLNNRPKPGSDLPLPVGAERKNVLELEK